MSIEETLASLGTSPVHPGLDGIEAGVFARIDAEAHMRRRSRRGMLAAMGAATLAGVAGAAIPAGHSGQPTVVLAPTALAPSTLLGGGE